MDETQLLYSRLEDMIYSSYYDGCAYIGFLNERECALCASYLRNRGVDFTIFGGYKNATRVYFAVGDNSAADFPIRALHIFSKGSKELTHRDYLGSLMGLGIKRECVGDIITLNNKEAVVFVRDEIASHIVRDLDKVGRDSITITEYTGDTDILSNSTEELSVIVTSMRVDNFVSACINSSRSVAVQLISSDMVFINYTQINKISRTVSEGDVVSIRGYGKYIVGPLKSKTKRDRLVINVLHYI